MGATSLGRQFGFSLDDDVSTPVHSFGVGKIEREAERPAMICLALGVSGEIDAPVTLTVDLEQADDLITLLQSTVNAARWAGVN